MRTLEQHRFFSARWLPVAAVSLLASVAGPVFASSSGAGPQRPNIVLILIDDSRAIELEVGFGRSLETWVSAVETELVQKGTVLENFFNSTAYCCPSRTSYLTGLYSHNHLVFGNNYNVSVGNGGWKRFWELGYEYASLGKWLQDGGYETVLIGKFLNQYPNKPSNFLPEEYVPIGWDRWFGSFTNDLPFSYYQFRMNENGVVVEYGQGSPAYLTDVERGHAVDYIDQYNGNKPFFMYLAPFSPHGPIEEAPRHTGLNFDVWVEGPPSFNESDLSDKPTYVQDGAVELPSFWNHGWNRRLDMTLSIDELIQAVVDSLDAKGLLDNTYIFFTSDNGLMWGEHGLLGKAVPYEESIRIPLVVRGPGIAEMRTAHHLTLNTDITPTILELAQVPIPPTVDGASMVEVLTGQISAVDWRDAVLIELNLAGPSLTSELPEASLGADFTVPAYEGVRTLGHSYIEYENGERELYDLFADPYQLDSFADTAPTEVLTPLQISLQALRSCAGAACQTASQQGAPNARPAAVWTYSCDDLTLTCIFDGSGSFDLDGVVLDYDWDFGDGSQAQGAVVDHSYAVTANYTVTLSVTDDEGLTNATVERILVGDQEVFDDGFESGDTSQWDVSIGGS